MNGTHANECPIMHSLTTHVLSRQPTRTHSWVWVLLTLGQKIRFPSRPWPELRYNRWRVSGLDLVEAWVVPSSSTATTPDKGGQTDQLALCQSN